MIVREALSFVIFHSIFYIESNKQIKIHSNEPEVLKLNYLNGHFEAKLSMKSEVN